MNFQFVALILLMFALGSAACGMLYAGYSWGRFAAVQALRNGSSKWKAYLTALVPPALLALCFRIDPNLAPHAAQAFFGLAAPVAVGTCLRYAAGLEES